jgi:hypothetical protein
LVNADKRVGELRIEVSRQREVISKLTADNSRLLRDSITVNRSANGA